MDYLWIRHVPNEENEKPDKNTLFIEAVFSEVVSGELLLRIWKRKPFLIIFEIHFIEGPSMYIGFQKVHISKGRPLFIIYVLALQK